MMPWFLRDPERLNLERRGVEELVRSANWLVGAEWLLNDDGLCLDAVIRTKGHDYDVRVSFPTLYPDAPIIVRPRKMQSRISMHQYGGADGPLCLEWGPDNWHRDITAVQMLESTYRLFDIENPLGENQPDIAAVAPSRHKLTIGQQFRSKRLRWLETRALSNFINGQPVNTAGSFKFTFQKAGEIWTSLIHEATPFGGSTWIDNQIPTVLPGAITDEVGIWLKTDLGQNTIGQPATLKDLRDLLAGMEQAKFLTTNGTSPVDGFGKSMSGVLIADATNELHLFIMVFTDEDVIACSRVQPEDIQGRNRAPERGKLNGKKIGIVGLGSVGSKIALSLARMGCGKFYLVDHDLLLPENLQRHALDWQGVVQHKVDAMQAAISLVAPEVQTEVSRLNLTGQESNASISGALNRLADCDILIDATSNPRVFNLLASVARSARRPMVWMEVFGGGIGGLIARSRPGIDPTPHDMRGAYLQYCTEHPAPHLEIVPGNYAVETEDGEVLVASDADVTIIAHHAVRFVPDCLDTPERSRFPYSMYLIGLAKGWTFEAPFDTIPISMASYAIEGWDNGNKQELDLEGVQFLCELLKKDDSSPSNTP